MALITCKHCGKKVSDTVSNCIHCGKSLKDEPIVPAPQPTIQKTALSEKKSFNSLNVKTQNQLEKEFLSTNKKFLKCKRQRTELKKLYMLGFITAVLGLSWLEGIRDFITEKVFKGEIYNESLFVVSNIASWILIVLGLICFFTNFISKVSYDRSAKKYIYLKSFQKWLRETKNIHYEPTFGTEREKEIFNEIDLQKMNL